MKRNADVIAEYEISDNLITYQSGSKSQSLKKVLRVIGPWLTTLWDYCKVEKLNKVIREWCYPEDATIITHQSGDKSQRLIKVLRLVGPWLTWQDWRKLEKLNKVVREWCHSEDAAICLFGLWRELTTSPYEVATHVNFMKFLARGTIFENPIPFLGYTNTCGYKNGTHNIRLGALYQSLLELSDLEKKIAGNASCTGRCVRSDPLPITGDKGDQWLLIDWSDLEKTNCIPPYYHLNFAVPKGLKIILSDQDKYAFYDSYGLREKIHMTIGRAAALGLSGLIVYYDDPYVIRKVLESFVSTLQEQKYGEFVSPLETLSFPYPGKCLGNAKECNILFRDVLTSLRNQIILGKLRNLKYLKIIFVNWNEKTDLNLREILYACPNLQVLEMGSCSNYEYLQNIKLRNIVHGPHNSIDFDSIDPCTAWKGLKSTHLSGLYIGKYSLNRNIAIDGTQGGLFSSLRVILCDSELEDDETTSALAIGCPDLRFLQIYYSDLYRCDANWNELLKRLFVLILNMHCERDMPRPLPISCFSDGCELRVLTVYGDYCSELLLWLEGLLNIIDVYLPKLFLLNVIFDRYYDGSLSEIPGCRENLVYHFRQKSIDLRFAYPSEKDW